MDLDETRVQLKILLDLLYKKKSILEQILTITENQFLIIHSDEKNMGFLDEMVKEKSHLIDKVNEIDEHFLNLYNKISFQIKKNADLYKDIIKKLQERIKDISDTDAKIKIQEEKNRQELLININSKNRKRGLFKPKKEIIDAYKKYGLKKDH